MRTSLEADGFGSESTTPVLSRATNYVNANITTFSTLQSAEETAHGLRMFTFARPLLKKSKRLHDRLLATPFSEDVMSVAPLLIKGAFSSFTVSELGFTSNEVKLSISPYVCKALVQALYGHLDQVRLQSKTQTLFSYISESTMNSLVLADVDEGSVASFVEPMNAGLVAGLDVLEFTDEEVPTVLSGIHAGQVSGVADIDFVDESIQALVLREASRVTIFQALAYAADMSALNTLLETMSTAMITHLPMTGYEGDELSNLVKYVGHGSIEGLSDLTTLGYPVSDLKNAASAIASGLIDQILTQDFSEYALVDGAAISMNTMIDNLTEGLIASIDDATFTSGDSDDIHDGIVIQISDSVESAFALGSLTELSEADYIANIIDSATIGLQSVTTLSESERAAIAGHTMSAALTNLDTSLMTTDEINVYSGDLVTSQLNYLFDITWVDSDELQNAIVDMSDQVFTALTDELSVSDATLIRDHIIGEVRTRLSTEGYSSDEVDAVEVTLLNAL